MRLANAAKIFVIAAAINELYKLLSPELASTEQAKRLHEYGCVTEMDIVRLIYRPVEPQGAAKTYDFSRSSMEKQQGTFDARTCIARVAMACAGTKGVGCPRFRCAERRFPLKDRSLIRENLVDRNPTETFSRLRK